jgi:hypothetical protein
MPALLFTAHLLDQEGNAPTELVKILFGVNSVAEKEQSFRELCQQRYPTLRIKEPIRIAPARLG